MPETDLIKGQDMPFRQNILIVDAEPASARELAELFEHEYGVIVAVSAKEALDRAIAERRPDLILLNVTMPDTDGYELCQRLKASEATRDIPVVFVADAGGDENEARGFQVGAADYIVRPLSPMATKARVRVQMEFQRYRQDVERLVREKDELNADLESEKLQAAQEHARALGLLFRNEVQQVQLEALNQNLEAKVLERTEQIRGLLKTLEQGFHHLVRVFIEMTELFDPRLGGHAKRVAVLAVRIAEACELSKQEVELVEVSALLHDIGLIGLPRSLFERQEDALGPDELALIRQHPSTGYEILQKIDSLKPAAVLVKHHHENFGGAGYPDGLAKGEIPFGARIIRVANDFDNMINRAKASRKDAMNHLQARTGREYDPKVVLTLLDALRQLETGAPTGVAVKLEDLRPGMVLTKSVRTKHGRFLLSENTKLETFHLTRLYRFHKLETIVDKIYVRATST